ncbi:MAG: protein BatD [Deltaproteobacteria bacterium]|nr:protein BatD [Deltaproteobacteria bacterium]
MRAAWLIYGVVLLAAPAQAAGLAVSTALSDGRVTVGDVVTLEIRAVAQVEGALELQIPRVDGLTELSRSQSEGTSISWTNNGQKITREQSLQIDYQVEKAGRIDIPPVTGRIGSIEARSSPLALVVDGNDAPASGTVLGPGEVAPPEAGERELFVRYRVSQPEAYLGQEILLDLEIFVDPTATFSISDSVNPPELDGFWREILDQPKRLERRAERIGNRTYHVYRVWRLALYGLEAGERTLEPATLTFTQGQSIFGGGRRSRRRSLPVTIRVKPLPTEGRPADFNNNNVGQYELSATLDRDQVPAGKAVVLTVTLSGSGNIKSARLPAIDNLPGFRVFPPTLKEHPELTREGQRGRKSAEILLMPESGGRLEIPSLALSIFDPIGQTYRRLHTTSLRVAVDGTPTPTPSDPPPSAEVSTPTLSPDKVSRPALRPLRYRSSLPTPGSAPWRQPWFWGLLLGPWVLYGGVLAFARTFQSLRAETPERQRRAARRHAHQRLAEARAALEKGELGAAHAHFSEAVLDFGSQKLGRVLKGLTHEQVEATFTAQSPGSDLGPRVRRALEAADFARFAPGAVSASEGAALTARWEALLTEIDALPGEAPR